jgi:RNA polymerase sigma-70 factor (ECF subfamily)
MKLTRSTLAPQNPEAAGRTNIRSISDAELVFRVSHHEKQALETLYNRYSGAVMGLSLKMLGERDSAEEIVQETFWRVWNRAETYSSGSGAFTSWLFGIAHHLVVDEVRRRRVRPLTTPLDDASDSVPELSDTEPDVAESALQSVTRAQVRAALDDLPAAQRRVIELAYFEGLTHQEIAERLEQPLGTIHTRARLGIEKLRAILMPLEAENLA